MDGPNLETLKTTVNILKERSLNVHAAEVAKAIQWIELRRADIIPADFNNSLVQNNTEEIHNDGEPYSESTDSD